MYYEDDFNAEYQIPPRFLTPKQDKIDTAVTAAIEPLQKSDALGAYAAQNDHQIYEELTKISNEVIKCRNAILAKIS